MYWGAVKQFTGIPTSSITDLGCAFLFVGSPCSYTLSSFIAVPHHIPQHELWSNGRYDT